MAESSFVPPADATPAGAVEPVVSSETRVRIERVAPSGKINRKVSVAKGDESAIDALWRVAFKAFCDLDDAIAERYETGPQA
jgi:hypothetical protein